MFSQSILYNAEKKDREKLEVFVVVLYAARTARASRSGAQTDAETREKKRGAKLLQSLLILLNVEALSKLIWLFLLNFPPPPLFKRQCYLVSLLWCTIWKCQALCFIN